MADKDELDSTQPSGQPAADPAAGASHGAHAIEPAVSGVPADADEPTFRDRERLADQGEDEEPYHEDLELVSVAAGSEERSAVATRDGSGAVAGRSRKAKPPEQSQPLDKDRRTGPVTFLKESVAELQKVVYPTGQQLINYFVVVLIFVLFIIGIVSLLDLAFGAAILKIFS